MILRLALPTPLRRLFDYLPPSDCKHQLVAVGQRAQVSFSNRRMVGVIAELAETTDIASDKLKCVESILDETPLLATDLLAFLRWCADYYHHPLGEVLQTAMPSLLRSGKPTPIAKLDSLRVTEQGAACIPEQTLSRSTKQRELLIFLQQQQISTRANLKQLNYSSANIKALLDKGLIEACNATEAEIGPTANTAPTLNPEQSEAVDHIISHTGYQCTLLAGVTGSGKTEVYLQAISHILGRSQQALVLVPEIGLTPQTLTRFNQRFGSRIAILHSNCSDGERLAAWEAARQHRVDIVIGTRSAIFTPMAALGIIIVDEEHDNSYKQMDGLRYSARDLAVVRAGRDRIPVVLGSATPSLESLANVRQGRYHIAKLTTRATQVSMPAINLLDIRHAQLRDGLAPDSIFAIQQTLQAGWQAMVFINRRGYAPVVMCHDCGWHALCQHCESRMTVHLRPPHLHCHHCDQRAALPKTCPQCRSRQLINLGQGTERVEATLQEIFPGTPIFRVDRDSTSRKNAMQDMLKDIHAAGPSILVGTQMLAKGHHFPKLQLVVVLDADSGLFSADFRGPERMGQLLVQVAGRAGREAEGGYILIQTHQPDHPHLLMLARQGYFRFANELLEQRRLQQLPPHQFMAIVRADANHNEQPEQFLAQARQQLEAITAGTIDIIGPLPSPMPKRAGRFRAQLILQSPSRAQLHPALHQLCHILETSKSPSQLRWSIDVDPQDMF